MEFYLSPTKWLVSHRSKLPILLCAEGVSVDSIMPHKASSGRVNLIINGSIQAEPAGDRIAVLSRR
jgi:hypothetical protein